MFSNFAHPNLHNQYKCFFAVFYSEYLFPLEFLDARNDSIFLGLAFVSRCIHTQSSTSGAICQSFNLS